MSWIVFWVLVHLIVQWIRRVREPVPAPLCTDCIFAHIQYTTSGGRVISCTFGGGVRLVGMNVMYCTDYRDRNQPRRVAAVGFVSQIEPAEDVAA